MKKLSGNQIRQMWLDFFRSKGHEVIPSASLIPHNDPTLLWINAGVAPLKKYFDGREKPNNPRMVNAQKSIRTNDIDNVGRTARHHTFFEMLGNFSIGDYFRNEALTWGFELLTSDKYFGLDLNRLYFTYYPTDMDTFNKWVSLGVDPTHLIPLEGNFWEIGEGPCGPDTEIFFDRGEKYDPEHIGIRLLKEDLENDRYIEIWNIVFSQFNSKEGVDRSKYKELPSKNIDTGMGLERITCIMQETPTNYETDLFYPLIQFVEQYTGIKYTGQMAFKVIADHIRSVTFAISDGAMLSNEGRGYVLRRLLRRAVRYGRKLGINEPFLYKMVKTVVAIMEGYYPYLKDQMPLVERLIRIEEEKFLQTLETGEKKLLDIIQNNPGKAISGASAFLLYDTFGFPFELTKEVAEENGVSVDEEGFKAELENQRERARQARNDEQSMNLQNADYLTFTKTVRFVGYEQLTADKARIIGLFKNGKTTDVLDSNGLVVTDVTPFYGESGGQVGDTGKLYIGEKELNVIDTIRLPHEQIAHLVEADQISLRLGDEVRLEVDAKRRNHIRANHSATHLLNQSLRNVMGNHVVQQGSSVTDSSLRFDFNHYQSLTDEEILAVEAKVKETIRQGYSVRTILTTVNEAKALGAQAVFGEKYGNVVRLVDMNYSKELCGGTHVANTGEIGDFAITGIEAKGSGIFRIEGATMDRIKENLHKAMVNVNQEIVTLINKGHNIVSEGKDKGMELSFDFQPDDTVEPSYAYVIRKHNELETLKQQLKELEKAYDARYREQGSKDYSRFLKQVSTHGEDHYLVARVDDVDISILKDMVDKLANHFEKIVIAFVDVFSDHLTFVAKGKASRIHCGELVKMAATFTGGNGGGRSDFSQAGGKDPSKADEVVGLIRKMIEEKI